MCPTAAGPAGREGSQVPAQAGAQAEAAPGRGAAGLRRGGQQIDASLSCRPLSHVDLSLM